MVLVCVIMVVMTMVMGIIMLVNFVDMLGCLVAVQYAGLGIDLVEKGRTEVAEVTERQGPFGHSMGRQDTGGIQTLCFLLYVILALVVEAVLTMAVVIMTVFFMTVFMIMVVIIMVIIVVI